MKKYAIFGGTFDPIHLGHVAVAQHVRDALDLDEVIFVPNARNPLRKAPIASVTDRLRMCQLALLGESGLSVSDIEATRGGESFTIDTVEEFLLVNPGQIWLILGADALKSFDQWRDFEKLVRRSRLAVVARDGIMVESILRSLPESVEDAVDMIEMKEVNISSSKIRDQIHRGNFVGNWLKPEVLEYISERGIYTS
ncbi:nicotinate-nucleotide adenylyltransferase [Kamptonema cortianum]|nr:nicotinate-nucleotide adenylyltransferase [Geitlerinema splendidum]MDK3156082.1 nicotinate-nucleotide adenylyltransferase [Kamptonema cortianum]